MYLIDTNDLGFAQGVPTQIKNTTGFPDGPEELDDHIGDQKKISNAIPCKCSTLWSLQACQIQSFPE